MNETMVDNWNRVVRPNDHVWHLGDVAMGFGHGHHEALLRRLKGHKRLVVGNHDNIKRWGRSNIFEKIELWRGFHGEQAFTCVHIPLALGHLRDGSFCVHGHIHDNNLDDPHYLNVCVEQTNYTPISMEEIIAIKKARNL